MRLPPGVSALPFLRRRHRCGHGHAFDLQGARGISRALAVKSDIALEYELEYNRF